MTISKRLTGQEQAHLWWLAAIPAHVDQRRDQSGKANIPTCLDTSLPWLQDAARNGWSARMFLHQMIKISAPHWTPSDTEMLLSQQMPLRLQLKTDGAISLLDQMDPINYDNSANYLSSRAICGLLNRSARRHQPVFVLLRTDKDMTLGTITYGKADDCESLTVKNADGSQDFLTDGLQKYLRQELQRCMAIP